MINLTLDVLISLLISVYWNSLIARSAMHLNWKMVANNENNIDWKQQQQLGRTQQRTCESVIGLNTAAVCFSLRRSSISCCSWWCWGGWWWWWFDLTAAVLPPHQLPQSSFARPHAQAQPHAGASLLLRRTGHPVKDRDIQCITYTLLYVGCVATRNSEDDEKMKLNAQTQTKFHETVLFYTKFLVLQVSVMNP